ncbi:MAG: TIR domain-containing protein [Oscillospiraceae bacterium]
MIIFISHSSKNMDSASKICERLESQGHSCFFAPRDIRSGYEYAEEIINGIDRSDVILLLMSKASNESPHVLREIERAVSKKKPIIVYKLEEVTLSKSMEYFLMTHQWVSSDGSKNFDDIIQRINEYAAAHENDYQQAQPAIAVNPPEKTTDFRRRVWYIVAAAAAVLAIGAGVGIFLSATRGVEASAPVIEKAESTSFSAATASAEAAQTDPKPAESNTDAAQTSAADSAQSESAVLSEPQITSSVTEETPPATTSQQSAALQTSVTEISSEPDEKESAAAVEIGDSLRLGTYNGEPVVWRVLRITDNGTRAVVISDRILTMKAYDAAEGGVYNKYDGKDYWTAHLSEIPQDIQRMIRGDNRWEFSNIRTWLNSERENVVYADSAPTSKAMSEQRNGYHTEAGFLNGFTKAERAALVESEITTCGAVTRDKVFLISSEELEWLYEADVSVFAQPTQAAVEQDKSLWYRVDCDAYGVSDHFWWLRDANPNNACECNYVNISYTDKRIASGSVGLEGYGIRPAMTVDLTSEAVKNALEAEN